jgi:GTP-binding protein EngB required for normal cell division
MNREASGSSDALNEFQKRRLRITCEYIDKLLTDVETVLNQASSKTSFPRYHTDLSPAQRRTIEDYIARIRAQLLRILEGQDIAKEKPSIGTRHAIHVALTFVDIAAEELYPKYMRGYGAVPEKAVTDLNGIVGELRGLVSKLDRYVLEGVGEDLKQRLERLERTGDEIRLLQKVEQVVSNRGLVEFRAPVANILDRLEEKSFEIAVFGRVSSGKSSLLNAILETSVLPVGVTPITAVPTRISHAEKPSMTVAFTDRPAQQLEISRLSEFATEQLNPGNSKHVSRIVVKLPAPRLRDGVTFVDTPGLGSLATSGAAETLAYLPKCDLGVVLIDASSTLTPDDLRTIQALNEAAVPAAVLLSKSDLLTLPDRKRVIAYVKEHIATECGLDLAVHPVSTLAGHRDMLNLWFENQIVPLYEQCQELRAASLRRKIGLLRDSVLSSLRSRLRAVGSESSPTEDQIRDVESRLRKATGKIEEVGLHIERELERMASNIHEPVERMAAELMTAWVGRNAAEIRAVDVARQALARFVQEKVDVRRHELESLATNLVANLHSAAQALNLPDKPPEQEFLSLIRELPIFEAGIFEVRASRRTLASIFGRRFAQNQLARELDRRIGNQVSAALDTHGELLRKWTVRVLKELKLHFDSYADGYRAQAERLLGTKALSPEEERSIRQDVHLLETEDLSREQVLEEARGPGRGGQTSA